MPFDSPRNCFEIFGVDARFGKFFENFSFNWIATVITVDIVKYGISLAIHGRAILNLSLVAI
jgi:hypothetical protein